jgi:hypothetical protein
MLFQRILQNTDKRPLRRQKVRSTWTTLLSAFGQKDEKDDDYDPLETMAAKSDSNIAADPASQVEQGEIVGLIEQAVSRLPARQRQAFLLRYWEELDVAEAAAAMAARRQCEDALFPGGPGAGGYAEGQRCFHERRTRNRKNNGLSRPRLGRAQVRHGLSLAVARRKPRPPWPSPSTRPSCAGRRRRAGGSSASEIS